MSEDIINRLKRMRNNLPALPFNDEMAEIISETIKEIEFLRTHAGAITRGDSFDDILRKTGPQKRGEAS